MEENLSQVSKIVAAENNVVGFFSDKWALARKNNDFQRVKHWTDDEQAKFRANGRIPYNFDRTSHILNTILGDQRANRLDITFQERTPEDAPRVNVLNAVWKYYEDLNKYIFTESDVYRDGVASQLGCFEIGITKERGLPDLFVRRVPYDMVLWDLNSREYDLSDAQWFSKRVFYTRQALKAKYPDKAELIDMGGFDAAVDGQVRPLKVKLWFEPERMLVGVREFYERKFRKKYLIWQRGADEPEEQPYESKEQAEEEIRNRMQIFIQLASQAAMMGQQIPTPEFEVMDFDAPFIEKTCAMINGVLSEPEEFPLGKFPFSLYFSYFHDGEYWTVMDRMRDPQIFYDRMMAQADYSIGTMAKGLLRIDPSMPKNKRDAIKQGWGKTGGAFEAKQGQIEQFESKGPAPQLFSLIDRAREVMDDQYGGANFGGLKETASESGRAVLARQAAAGLDNFTLQDNMRRTKADLGYKIAWYLTNEITYAKELRITANPLEMQALKQQGIIKEHPQRPNVGYVEVNTEPTNSIENLEVDVVVTEAQHSPTKQMADLAAMTDAFKSGMIPAPPPPQVLIDMMPIGQQQKDAWKAEFQNKPEPQPKVTVQINYKDLPPSVQNQVEAKLLEVEPNPHENAIIKKKEIDSKDPQLTQKEKGGDGKN